MDILKKLSKTIITAACGCNMGLRRKNNEDNFYFHGEYMNTDNEGMDEIYVIKDVLTPYPEEDYFFAVFDGMGGGDYGELASYEAAKTASSYLEDESSVNPYDITPSLEQLCHRMNDRVFQTGLNLGTTQMGSTVASVFFHGDQAWVFNLGDSRCYLLRDGIMKQISVDHNDAEMLEANGITNRKPYLTQYLGIDSEEMRIEPYIQSMYYERGDIFLICSDGLTDMVEERDIKRILEQRDKPQDKVRNLIEAALNGGGKDNITVIVCQIN